MSDDIGVRGLAIERVYIYVHASVYVCTYLCMHLCICAIDTYINVCIYVCAYNVGHVYIAYVMGVFRGLPVQIPQINCKIKNT